MKRSDERTFDKFPLNETCPVCGTNEQGECVLIPVDGTEDGSVCEAVPVHRDCINASVCRIDSSRTVIYIEVKS